MSCQLFDRRRPSAARRGRPAAGARCVASASSTCATQAIKQVADGWAASPHAGRRALPPPSRRSARTQSLSPYLVIRVNGVPIAARGGNWGMDDSRKRSSREQLEPYLPAAPRGPPQHHPQLAGPEHRRGVLRPGRRIRPAWYSTTSGSRPRTSSSRPQDPALFLANARDTIRRYRNHPSIAVWFGRNEGVPQPIINEGLDDLIATLDGTRYYTGSSNRVNLQDSGPYNYRPPVGYFTDLDARLLGRGRHSLACRHSNPSRPPSRSRPLAAQRHQGLSRLAPRRKRRRRDLHGRARRLSSAPPTSLEDFERKAQMMNYVDYRAVFEGFLAHCGPRTAAACCG